MTFVEIGMGQITVLCVDDDPDLVTLTASLLEETNERFETVAETNPRAAIERLKTGSIDCVVSDYDMPEMNGLELLESVRNDYPELPFILFTGKGDDEVASAAMAQDVTDYFLKGAESGQYSRLAERIATATQGRTGQPEIYTSN
ncbi:response regulator [Halorhabdus sp. BNX81]|uniref:response regulator n=1 Tax=Halorhabdus sp. BNX81 TaxID=2980181 RepID=UPI0023DD1BFB|nr:response regulator [Halorhabdus sp. BNX81]